MRSKRDDHTEDAPSSQGFVALDKEKLLSLLDDLTARRTLRALKRKTDALKQAVASAGNNGDGLLVGGANGNAISLRKDVLVSELDQVLEARTIERARYYLKRLERGLKRVKTSRINDINLMRWKEYEEVITDSLWNLPKRDTTGAHLGWYWGNFIPQIPRQLMLRYTKKGEGVLDAFAGSGTTLIECRRLGRNGVGIELNAKVARKAAALIARESNPDSVITEIITGDSRTVDLGNALDGIHTKQFQLLIMHPPYHDIIGFSEDEKDLSTATTTREFLNLFGEVVDNLSPLLERGRHLALVIGDKYSKGEWIPLGFQCMNEVLERGFLLKSVVVKNFEETRAKRDQKQLWRYRALAGGFYIFKHEYIFLFKKR
jgi:hypothetical protein